MSQSCWTCRDRKIRCDRALPTCVNCAKSHRKCIRLDFRLSWPRDGDKRRAQVYDPSSIVEDENRRESPHELFLVNVSSHDIHLSNKIPRSRSATESSASAAPDSPNARGLWSIDYYAPNHIFRGPVPIPKALSWQLFGEQARPHIDHYLKRGSHFFSSHQGEFLAPLVLKIAMSDTNTSSKAVLEAIQALSCSQLGQLEEAFAHRDTAVAHLSTSLTTGCGPKVAFQNITTSMLLCMFEIYLVSETAVNWAVYLCGVKTIIKDALTELKSVDKEFIAIKDWVYYYEVLARFGLMHWIDNAEKYPLCYTGPMSGLIKIDTDSSSDDICDIGYSRSLFDSVSDLTDLLLPSRVSSMTPFERQRLVSDIEARLHSTKQRIALQDFSNADEKQSKTAQIQHLYLLATLIYLNKAALQYYGGEPYHLRLVEEAISLVDNIQIWEAPWAFLIVCCEAQHDTQRKRLLQRSHTSRSESLPDNNMLTLHLAEAFWNQDDLDTEQNLSYTDKLTAVISASPFLPVFT